MERDPLSDQLRRSIAASGLSRYAICKRTKIDQSTMSRFMHRKGGLSGPAIDRLGELLGLRLVAEPRETDEGD